MASVRVWPLLEGDVLSEQDAPRAVSALAPNHSAVTVDTLKKRSDFIAIGKSGKRFACPFFVLISQKRSPEGRDSDIRPSMRVGYTVSKKVDKKAVIRNLIKRRLREAVRAELPNHGTAGTDYVLIARRAAETAPFNELTERLQFALKWLHRHSS